MPNRIQQVLTTPGGLKTFTSYSGTAGGDALIWSGAGRVDLATIFALTATMTASGKPIFLYDAGAAVSGGPLASSGHNVVACLQPANPASGVIMYGEVRQLGFEFFSGLCYSSTSGAAGFTVSYTPNKGT